MQGIQAFIFAMLLAIGSFGQEARESEEQEIAPEEYSVLASVLERMTVEEVFTRPIVSDRTSTFQCGRSCNGLEIGGCSGMRTKTETSAAALKRVREVFAELEERTLANFESNNQTCAKIEKRLPTSVEHYRFSAEWFENHPKSWKRPDMVYFSRVGFSPEGVQGLVYMGLMSGRDARRSGGYYVLVNKNGRKWEVKNALKVWSLIP